MALSRKIGLPNHPCMNDSAHGTIARIHLPVAFACNIHCGYCARKTGVTDPTFHKPGTCDTLLTPEEALVEAVDFLKVWGADSIVGIAGPGDPLANRETFETLQMLHETLPGTRLCLCTNGLNLPDSVEVLVRYGVRHISVTMNALTPDVLAMIHPFIRLGERTLRGEAAARILLENQMSGIAKAVDAGVFVKINTVVIPGINDRCIRDLAEGVAGIGAGIINLMPLIPSGMFSHVNPPSDVLMRSLYRECASHIHVFSKCSQCRADARGIPGKEGCRWKKTA